jgi:hypothetical protein
MRSGRRDRSCWGDAQGGITALPIPLAGTKGQLSHSQSSFSSVSAPLTGRGRDFVSLTRQVLESLLRLPICQPALKRLEQLLANAQSSGLSLTERHRRASQKQFFANWSAFMNAVVSHSKTPTLVRARDFFQSEIPIIRSSIIAFPGPRQRVGVTSAIRSLESELRAFKIKSPRLHSIKRHIASLVTSFQTCVSKRPDLLRSAIDHLTRLDGPLSEFSSGEPNFRSFVTSLEKTTRELTALLSPEQLPPVAATVAEAPRPPVRRTAIPVALPVSLRQDLAHELAECNRAIERQIECGQVIAGDLSGRRESQTVAFSNAQLQGEVHQLLRELSRLQSEIRFRDDGRNAQSCIGSGDPEGLFIATEFLKAENADLADQIRLLGNDIDAVDHLIRVDRTRPSDGEIIQHEKASL